MIRAPQFRPSLSVADTLEAYRSGESDPEQLLSDTMLRIREDDPLVHAFVHVDEDVARHEATVSAERWRSGTARALEGLPIAVKDVESDAATPPRFGFAEAHGAAPTQDSPSMRTLRRAGAIIVGKTTTPQVGWRATTDAPGAPATRNPHDLAMTSGGSSGGSAAAVAAGMVPAALGTDGGGSVRIPASFCGLVGFKPTYGRIPQWPASGVGSLGHTGPITQSVADAALLFDVLSAFDARDGVAVRECASEDVLDTRRPPRIAYSGDLGFASYVDPEVAALARRAAERLADFGFEVVEETPPLDDPTSIFRTLWDTSFAAIVSTLAPTWADGIEPGLRETVERGRRIPAVELALAEMQRINLAGVMASFHERWDLLLTPTVAIPAFEAGRITPAGWDGHWTQWTPFTWPFNLTQQPALTVPAGLTRAGLPVGVQLVGPRFGDRAVLRAGEALERALA